MSAQPVQTAAEREAVLASASDGHIYCFDLTTPHGLRGAELTATQSESVRESLRLAKITGSHYLIALLPFQANGRAFVVLAMEDNLGEGIEEIFQRSRDFGVHFAVVVVPYHQPIVDEFVRRQDVAGSA